MSHYSLPDPFDGRPIHRFHWVCRQPDHTHLLPIPAFLPSLPVQHFSRWVWRNGTHSARDAANAGSLSNYQKIKVDNRYLLLESFHPVTFFACQFGTRFSGSPGHCRWLVQTGHPICPGGSFFIPLTQFSNLSILSVHPRRCFPIPLLSNFSKERSMGLLWTTRMPIALWQSSCWK